LVEREEGRQSRGAMKRDQGGRARSGMVKMLAVEPPATVENTRVAQRSAAARAAVIFFWRIETTGCG
jgi:hypothetical protein